MKKQTGPEIILWVLIFLPMAVTLALLPWLPQRLPIHWSIEGAVDGYGTPGSFLLLTVFLSVMQLLLKFLPSLDPRRENYKRFAGAYRMFRFVLALFFNALVGLTLYFAYNPQSTLDMTKIITAGIGVLFCVLGNFMPKFKHNYFVGIRTPWTLADEAVWYGTHRVGGRLWAVCGAAMVGCAVFLRAQVLFWCIMGIVLVCTLVPYIYSYILYKKVHTG